MDIISSLNLSEKEFTYTNNTLTTTMDIQDYIWMHKWSDKNDNNANIRNEFFNYGYAISKLGNTAKTQTNIYNVNDKLYMAVSSTAGSRSLAVGKQEVIGTSGTDTGFYALQSSVNSGFWMGFRGSSYYYNLYTEVVEGSFQVVSTTGNRPGSTNGIQANGRIGNTTYKPVYMYVATGVTETPITTLLSANGDTLDKDIHYMIAAKVSGEYYALTKVVEDNVVSFTSERVTTQFDTISPVELYQGSTMVPINSDWTQVVDGSNVRFIHTKTSTNSSKDYLDVDANGNLTITNLASTATVETQTFNYDIVHNLFKYTKGNTTYYLTYNAQTGTWGFSNNQANAAEIHMIRYSPTYNVKQVTNFTDEIFADGEFIIAGKGGAGYTAVGTTGTKIVSVDITNYLTDDLSEKDYNDILDYVWTQRYYDYVEGSNYTTDTSGGYVQVQLLAKSGKGGIAGISASNKNTLEPFTSTYTWKFTRQTDGTWKAVNNQKFGSTSSGSIGIKYSDNSKTELTILQHLKQIENYVGAYSYTSTLNNNASNFYLYSTTNGQKFTGTPVQNTAYFVVAEVTSTYSKKVIAYIDGNQVKFEDYDVNKLSTYQANNKYKFTSTASSASSFALKNGSSYIYFNGNNFSVANAEPASKFKSTSGLLTATSIYYPSEANKDGVKTSINGSLSIKFYTFSSRDNKKFNLTPYSSGNYNVFVILKNGNKYSYLTVDGNDYKFKFVDLKAEEITVSDGEITQFNKDLTNSNNRYRAEFTLSENDGLYTLKSRTTNTNKYLTINNTNVSFSNNSTSVAYDTTKGLYYVDSTEAKLSYSFTEKVSVSADSNNAAKVIVYKVTADGFEATNGLEQNGEYIIFIGNAVGKVAGVNVYDYYLLSYDNSSNTIKYTYLGDEIKDYEDLLESGSYLVGGATSLYGVSLYFKNYTTKYLTTNNNQLSVGGTGKYFNCDYDPVYIDDSILYTVKDPSYEYSKFYAEGQAFMVTSNANVSTLLIKLTQNGGVYTNNGIYTSSTVNSGTYAIGVYQDNRYYFLSLNEQGEVVPVSYGAGIPSTFGASFAWTAGGSNGTYTFRPVSDNTKYLQTDAIGKLVVATTTADATLKYSATADNSETKFTAGNANEASNLYVFKVTKSDNLDLSSDTLTTINNKMEVKASLSVLDSTKYIIVANANNKYYALSVVDPTTTKALDITDTFKNAYNKEGTITLFDASVWNQIGTDYNLMFDSMGFADDDYYLLTGSYANRVGTKPSTYQTSTIPEDKTEYTWKVFEVGNEYVIGYEDQTITNSTSYIYFDSSDLTFKLTERIEIALSQNHLTNIYELGKEMDGVPAQTFEIALKSDGQTIESYPLREIEADEIAKYNDIQTEGRISKNVPGEYLITTYYQDRYYALTLNDNNEVEFIDVSLYFSGNFIINDASFYCLSISENYLWQQLETPTIADGVASGLRLKNVGKGQELSINGSNNLSFDGTQLYSANGYLVFNENGYSISTGESTIPIVIYSVGTGHVATGGNNTDLEYVYFTKGLSTYGETGVDFGAFNFSEKVINQLPNYAMSYDGEKIWEYKVNATDEVMQDGILLTRTVSNDEYAYFTESGESAIFQDGKVIVGTNIFTTYNDYIVKIGDDYYAKDETTLLAEYHGTNRSSGTLGYTIGWDKIDNEILEEVNSIVYFKDGIHYNSDATVFQNEFIAETRDYSVIDDTTNNAYVGTVNYYAPKGTAAFFVAQASEESPVLVNTIVSTKLDTTQFDVNKLRYLALWKAADFDAENGTLKTVEQYTGSDGTTQLDYAYALAKKFDTPYAAIPLANHYGAVNTTSPGSGASYVKVGSNGYNLSALKDATSSWDHLIAHTFLITEPGVYYIGSTYGSVSFAYVSISDVYLAEAGEDDADTMDQSFSIDFVWGDIAEDASSCQNGDDSALSDIAYVGRLSYKENGKVDHEKTWVNSNIYPEFKNGTNGLAGGDNPTDYLTFNVERLKTNVEDQNGEVVSIISSVNITVHTLSRIDDNGNGFMYRNMNTVTQRKTRKIEFEVIIDE